MEDKHYLVPAHTEGIETDLEHSVVARSIEDAEEWFVEAKNRLLDINHWERYDKHLGADFRLTDSQGKAVNRRAHRGDHLRLYLSSPPVSGNEHNWVIVEAIEYDDYPDEDRETLAMRIRPSSDPRNKPHDGTPHCPDMSSGTFVIERSHDRLTALYHRRVGPSIRSDGNFDCINNASSSEEWLGLSDSQWAGLIKSLLD